MQLIIDDKIPFIHGLAEQIGDVHYLPGANITAESVRNADAIIVRTRTKVDAALLAHSSVRLAVTATIGHDHINAAELAQLGIAWSNCPGCNAESVAQYVRNCLWCAIAAGHLSPQPSATCVGIVGVGHVGSAVDRALRAEGFRTLHCDPPKGEAATLADVAQQCQVVTLHTPLTHEGEHATFHLADANFFAQLRDCRVFINAARGECMDTDALKTALRSRKVGCAIIDTWENEPNIDHELLDLAFIATPHIAGYSADGKANGTRMSLAAVVKHFQLHVHPELLVQPPSLPPHFDYATLVLSDLPASSTEIYQQSLAKNTDILLPTAITQLKHYSPLADTLRLRHTPNSFEYQRGHYPLRREG